MDDFWSLAGRMERAYYRAHNVTGRVTMTLGDDTNPIQQHQIEGYQGEVRDGTQQRLQTFGFASLPLPGSKGLATYQSGHRGFATIIADEDPRYRPKGQQPGEMLVYMVDGAARDGTGGTMRQILKAALGWASSLFGQTIRIGTDADTQTITISAGTKITIKAPSIVLDGTVKLGGEDANKPASMQDTVDSRGDTDVSGLATKVLMK